MLLPEQARSDLERKLFSRGAEGELTQAPRLRSGVDRKGERFGPLWHEFDKNHLHNDLIRIQGHAEVCSINMGERDRRAI